jgi:hypothetical protein
MRSSLWLKKVRRMPVTIAGGASGGEKRHFLQENNKVVLRYAA